MVEELEFNRLELLKFYDEMHDGSDVSAITAMIGEDLVLGFLKHYLEYETLKDVRITHPCNAGANRGYRLDAWVVTDSEAYQTEVKNWSAHSMGGIPVSANAEENTILEIAGRNLDNYLKSRGIWKVLETMNAPIGKPTKPLLAFWSPVAIKELKPFFECSLKDYDQQINDAELRQRLDIDTVFIFSASIYLRQLYQTQKAEKMIKLSMPRATRRISKLNRLILDEFHHAFQNE